MPKANEEMAPGASLGRMKIGVRALLGLVATSAFVAMVLLLLSVGELNLRLESSARGGSLLHLWHLQIGVLWTVGIGITATLVAVRWLTTATGGLVDARDEIARITDQLLEEEATERELRAQLERRRRADEMSTFVAGVAHEVRNPLFAITANLQALQEETDKAAVFDEYFGWIQSSAIRLQVLMQDLLDYARPTSTQLAPGRLHEVIERSVAGCSALASRTGVELRIDGATDSPEILMDPQQLDQVFTNLIENAIAMSPPKATVRTSVYPEPTFGVVCAVEDSGPGFSPEEIERGFEPFFTRRKGGTGLGLAVVRRIMDGHGGTIDLGNRDTGGARVRLVFPPPPKASPVRSGGT